MEDNVQKNSLQLWETRKGLSMMLSSKQTGVSGITPFPMFQCWVWYGHEQEHAIDPKPLVPLESIVCQAELGFESMRCLPVEWISEYIADKNSPMVESPGYQDCILETQNLTINIWRTTWTTKGIDLLFPCL